LMDEANVFFAGIIRTTDNRITAAADEERNNVAWLRWVSILGGIVIVAVVGLAAHSAVHYTNVISQARDQIAEVNAGLEERVKLRTADLARANEEIQRFAQIVSHDLRAPLVNIVGFAKELETVTRELSADVANASEAELAPPLRAKLATAIDTDLPEAVGFIRSSTQKMDGLVNAILKLSREGQRSLSLQPIDPNQLITAGASAVKHQLNEANGTIAVDVEPGSVVCDRLSLEQIIGNLLDNAVKYRAQGRSLEITIRGRHRPDGGFTLDVADNGRGIAERDLPRVFDMFTRSGPLDQPGEGIGLAFVHAQVRNLGGQISVSSSEDVGTTFSLSLPPLEPSQ
jgi:signal transduction histidine kinase